MATTASYAGAAMPSQTYPSLPASPTLTNPDMILPDYDRPPSLDLDDHDLARSQSPLMMWKMSHAANSSSNLQHLYPDGSLDANLGPISPMTPTTPIIYGNGTMLSDIGEVTEVESTPGKPWTTRPRGDSSGNDSVIGPDLHGLQSSPTMGLDGVKKATRRSGSMDSTSTITTQDRLNMFADFDDSVSVGDSVFQGDDEDSVADSYTPDEPAPTHTTGRIAPAAAAAAAAAERRAANAGKELDPSPASLSQRAELILANAKRRLTTMEGNLNRARSSLHSHSPSLTSLGSDCSTPSPTAVFVTSPGFSSGRNSSHSPGHSRMGSENTLRIGLPVNVYPPRSASALGAAGGYRQQQHLLTTSRSVDNIRESAAQARSATRFGSRYGHLAPLSENQADGGSAMTQASGFRQTMSPTRDFLSPTFAFSSDNEHTLTRSASTNQMRELKDQVKDLKGKISSLREQARADSLRRRSFQSLRAASPFTHAPVDQWGGEASDPSEQAAAQTHNGPPWSADASGFDTDDAHANGSLPNGTTSAAGSNHVASPLVESKAADSNVGLDDLDVAVAQGTIGEDDDVSDMVTEDGDYDDEILDYDSESGDSAYHDTVQHPISHEDREDAFDYEHFILHSALGTIAEQRLARRERGSFSSEDSVETTRGPFTDVEPLRINGSGLRRSASHLSTATSTSVDSFESFATADEGRASRDGGRRTADGSSRSRTQSRVRAQNGDRENKTPPIAEEDGMSVEMAAAEDATTTSQSSSDAGGSGSGTSIGARHSPPRATVLRRSASSAAWSHVPNRPSVSSLESTGTMRSFPLVSRKKSTSLTSNPSSTGSQTAAAAATAAADPLNSISNQLLQDAAAFYGQRAGSSLSTGRSSPSKKGTALVEPNTPVAMQQLLREDQFLIERLVASIGKCVLGLTENGKSSTESRMYRRRLDAARKILEGTDNF